MKAIAKSSKTIQDAIKHLPKKEAEQILRGWNAAQCLDLYDGNLSDYLGVIATALQYYKDRCIAMQKASKAAIDMLQNIKHYK